jgi:hypothetical protein
MKIERRKVNAIEVTWPEGSVRTYLEKEALLNTINNRITGNKSCIEHAQRQVEAYKSQIAQYEAELHINLQCLEEANKLEE